MIVIASSLLFDQSSWLKLRMALWPDMSEEQHSAEMKAQLATPHCCAQFMAYWVEPDGKRIAIGFAEASLRNEAVNGAEEPHLPRAFLEGLYVADTRRREGTARKLLTAVIQWARMHNCHELLSDVLLENELGQRVHTALGFEETERVVCYRQRIN